MDRQKRVAYRRWETLLLYAAMPQAPSTAVFLGALVLCEFFVVLSSYDLSHCALQISLYSRYPDVIATNPGDWKRGEVHAAK